MAVIANAVITDIGAIIVLESEVTFLNSFIEKLALFLTKAVFCAFVGAVGLDATVTSEIFSTAALSSALARVPNMAAEPSAMTDTMAADKVKDKILFFNVGFLIIITPNNNIILPPYGYMIVTNIVKHCIFLHKML